jgi:hypothetical protein
MFRPRYSVLKNFAVLGNLSMKIWWKDFRQTLVISAQTANYF